MPRDARRAEVPSRHGAALQAHVRDRARELESQVAHARAEFDEAQGADQGAHRSQPASSRPSSGSRSARCCPAQPARRQESSSCSSRSRARGVRASTSSRARARAGRRVDIVPRMPTVVAAVAVVPVAYYVELPAGCGSRCSASCSSSSCGGSCAAGRRATAAPRVDVLGDDLAAAAFVQGYVTFLATFAWCSPRRTAGSGGPSRSSSSSSPPTPAPTPPGSCSASTRWRRVISPKKTWEGFAGRAVASLVAGVLPRRCSCSATRGGSGSSSAPRSSCTATARRPRRVADQARPRHQGHELVAAGPRRVPRPARLDPALGDRRAGVLSTSSPPWWHPHDGPVTPPPSPRPRPKKGYKKRAVDAFLHGRAAPTRRRRAADRDGGPRRSVPACRQAATRRTWMPRSAASKTPSPLASARDVLRAARRRAGSARPARPRRSCSTGWRGPKRQRFDRVSPLRSDTASRGRPRSPTSSRGTSRRVSGHDRRGARGGVPDAARRLSRGAGRCRARRGRRRDARGRLRRGRPRMARSGPSG